MTGRRSVTGPVQRREVGEIYASGVDSILGIASGLTVEQWDVAACGSWTATETARHVLAVAHWYHEWLDRALAGDTSRPFLAKDMDAHTAAALAEYRHLNGNEAIGAFAESALTYLDRALDHWEAPFGYPFGIVTIGLHAGVAAAEWHLHAWDLSTVTDTPHVPDQPGALFMAAGSCVARAEGGLKGAVISRLLPVGARRDPWGTLLKRSGRKPAD